jgi:hypothetical protein
MQKTIYLLSAVALLGSVYLMARPTTVPEYFIAEEQSYEEVDDMMMTTETEENINSESQTPLKYVASPYVGYF